MARTVFIIIRFNLHKSLVTRSEVSLYRFFRQRKDIFSSFFSYVPCNLYIPTFFLWSLLRFCRLLLHSINKDLHLHISWFYFPVLCHHPCSRKRDRGTIYVVMFILPAIITCSQWIMENRLIECQQETIVSWLENPS